MKFKLLLFLLLTSLSMNARFIAGSILFKDGHTEKGFIKSFMENEFFDFSLTQKIEKEFNLDDRTLKFKLSEDGELKTYNIKEIKEVHIDMNGGSISIYASLPLKTINKKGEIIDLKMHVWLPLIQRGKINLYGYQYSSYSHYTGPEYFSKFYFQKENDDFALNAYENVTMFNNKVNSIIYTAFYKYLFSDCPEFYAAKAEEFRKETHNDYSKEEKKEEMRAYAKRYQDYTSKSEFRTIKNAFELNYYQVSIFMDEYDDACN